MRWQGEAHSILDASDTFTSVVEQLEKFKSDKAIHGLDHCVFGKPIKEDEVYTKLCTPTDDDEKVECILGEMVECILRVMRRQLVDHLPGGKFHNPSDDLREDAQSCPQNNISGERVFAMWDARYRQSKSSHITKISNKVVFKSNKVKEKFLDGKTKEEKEQIFKEATKQARQDRKANKMRQQKLVDGMKEKLNASRKLIEKRENNRRESKEKTIECILEHGLWMTDEEIHTGVKGMSKTKALAVLRCQIKFRCDILGCTANRKFSASKATQQEHELFLIELIHLEIPDNSQLFIQIVNDPSFIVGFQFSQKWSNDSLVDNVCRGQILEHVTGKDAEYICQFEGEPTVTCQTVSEVLADMAVNDLLLYV